MSSLPIRHNKNTIEDSLVLNKNKDLKQKVSDGFIITVKKSKETTENIDYLLSKMNIMGNASNYYFSKLNPKDNNKTKFKKLKPVQMAALGGIGLLGTSGFNISSLKSVASKFNPFSNISSSKEKDDDNIFGLKEKDKGIINQLKKSTNKASDTFDRLINALSNRMIPGLPALIFNFSFYKQSGIYKLLTDNIKKYSSAVLDIFTKTIKEMFNWIKENLVPKPIRMLGGKVKWVYTNIKESAINLFNRVMNRESSALKQSGVTNDNYKEITSKGILGWVSNVVKRFAGDSSNNGNYSISKQNSKTRAQRVKPGNEKINSVKDLKISDNEITDIGKDPGDVKIDGSILNGSKVKPKAVYKAFREAGFSHAQALVLTSQVGRENNFDAVTAFGNHKDPARGRNLGFMSWQGSRKKELRKRLAAVGTLHKGGWSMDRTYTSLKVMANYVMWEMQNTHNNKKTKKFLANKNITFEEAAPLLGGAGTYIGWARGQNSIRLKSGRRIAFDWREQESRQKGYYNSIKKELNGKGDDGGGMNFSIETSTSFVASKKNSDILKRKDKKIGIFDKQPLLTKLLFKAISAPKYNNIQQRAQQALKPQSISNQIQLNTSSNSTPTINANTYTSKPISKAYQLSLFEIIMNNDLDGNMNLIL